MYTPAINTIDTNSTHLILQSVIHAHLCNTEAPGSFEEILKQTLKANNMLAIKIPNIPNSKKIIQLATQPDTPKAKPSQRTDEPEEEPKEQQAGETFGNQDRKRKA